MSQAQNQSIVDQLAGGETELFTSANYANAKGTKVEPAVRINATGCGWGGVPARAVALILKHPELAKKALAQCVADLKDQAKVKALLDAKKAKLAGKSTGKAVAASDDLDEMLAAV